MGQLLIRNLDKAVIAGLKRSASREKLSLEQYLRNMLKQHVEEDRAGWRERLDELHETIDLRPSEISVMDLLELDDADKHERLGGQHNSNAA